MLTESTGGGGTTAKSIAIKAGPSLNSGTVVYQVPAGRMFTGTIRAANSDTDSYSLNGLTISTSTNRELECNGFELGAGNVIAITNTNTQVVVAGIERDLA